MAGWIKINRDITSHWLWLDAERLKWWFDLLLMAAWTERKQLVGKHLVTLQKGQLIASVSFLCSRWERSRTMVEPYIDLLIAEGMIEKSVSHNISIITICNFEKYQTNDNAYIETDISAENSNGYAPSNDNQNAHLETHPDTDLDTHPEVHLDDTSKELIRNKEINNNILSSKDDMSGFGETPTPEPVNYEKLVTFFNSVTKGCFGLLRLPLGESRKKQIRARVAAYGKKSLETVIMKAAKSSFLCGDNNRNFIASFDWIIKPSNYEKILSGNYDNRESHNSERDNIGSKFVNRD